MLKFLSGWKKANGMPACAGMTTWIVEGWTLNKNGRHTREGGCPIFLFAGILFLLFVSAGPAFAAPTCYSPTELPAEHLLRLHSELMVITVTCRQGSQGEDLVAAYTGFTNRNIIVLHNAEQTMIRFYGGPGGKGVQKLDTLRTKLGNEYGQKIADMSAPAFCGAYRDRVVSFYRATSGDVQNEVLRMQTIEKSYVQPCLPATRVAGQSR
jgi:hypothetical protein